MRATREEARGSRLHLVWFRSDLRISDQPALRAAMASADRVEALFVAAPDQWRRHDWGNPKADFLRRTLEVLAGDLARLAIPFRCEIVPTFAEVPELVARVARETGATAVHVNRELEVNERRRDGDVVRLLESDGVELRQHHDQTIVAPGELATTAGDPYSVFTPFSRAWLRYLDERGLEPPLSPPEPTGPPIEPSEIPTRWPGFDGPLERVRSAWPAGELEARRRLDSFLEGPVFDYAESRDDVTDDGTSALSPYLAIGSLSPREVLARGMAVNEGRILEGDPGVSAWLRQLVWRDFYRHVLVAFPRVSKGRPFQRRTEWVAWEEDPEGLAAWREGRSGFPIVDAAMRCLAETGWMHNRLRMVVASFLTKDLLVDWREGERHFVRHLVDADLANNNGGWQWAASTGTDASPYFRIFNPWSQSRRYDPEGRFVRRWIPELSEVPDRALHDPKRLREEVEPSVYPRPIVDHAEARKRALAAFQDVRDAPERR